MVTVRVNRHLILNLILAAVLFSVKWYNFLVLWHQSIYQFAEMIKKEEI